MKKKRISRIARELRRVARLHGVWLSLPESVMLVKHYLYGSDGFRSETLLKAKRFIPTYLDPDDYWVEKKPEWFKSFLEEWSKKAGLST
jgi:hypothetical protein